MSAAPRYRLSKTLAELEACIPREMLQLSQWVGWKFEVRDGKATKVPLNPRTGTFAKSSDASTWTTFADAYAAFCRHPDWAGIGFVFSHRDHLAGVDLDNCIDEAGNLSDWARDIIERLPGYHESSPSGWGVKLFCRTSEPLAHNGKRSKYPVPGSAVEAYDKTRFFTVTGEALAPTPSPLPDIATQLAQWQAEVWPKKTETISALPAAGASMSLDDAEILARARGAKNGPTFEKLFAGDWKAAGYGSQSEADLSFAGLLAFWTGRDIDRMDRIFRASGLYRPKWERPEYGRATLEKAVADCREIFDPEKSNRAARRREERELRRSDPEQVRGHDFQRTDLGNAEHFALLFGNRVRFCYTTKIWHVWDGSRWKRDDAGTVGDLVNKTARKRFHDAREAGEPDKIKKEVAWALRSESASGRRACLDQAKTIPELGIDAESFDADQWLLNVENGTIDLRTGELREARREDYITKRAPVRFDASATCPLWDACLLRIMAGDAELISYLRRLVGYIITGAIREHVFVVFYGLGANGKGTFVETLAALLGPEFSHRLCIESLLASKRDGNVTNPDLAELKGKRFAFTSESNRGRQLDEGLVKAATGGDTMKYARKYENPVTFQPTHKIVMASNYKPSISGTDHGIWRRIHLVPFEVQIPKEERDLALPGKLLAELPGILNWAVQGCLEWQRQGLNPPQKVLAATEAYREESDALAEFFDEHCVLRPEAKVQAKDFYLAIKSWWEGRGEKPWSMKAVGAALLERGFTKRKSSGIWYDGVGLRATLGDDSTAPPPTNGRNGRVGDEFTKVLHEKASHEGLSETEFQPSHLPNPLLEASTSCPPPGSGTAPGLLRWLRSTYGVDVGLSSDGEPVIVAGEPHSGALSYIRSHRDAIAWHLSREGGEAA